MDVGASNSWTPLLFFFFFWVTTRGDASFFLMGGREERDAASFLGVEGFLTMKRCGVGNKYHMGWFGFSPIPNRIQDLGQILNNFWIQS